MHIPVVEKFVARLAEKMGSREGALLFEIINRGASAHFVGGIPIGDHADSGAVDPYLRLFGQPGLHVMDGSVMPANPGVNPSLTITALAERAMSLWPNKGDPDAGRRWAPATSASTRSCRTGPRCPPALPASCGSTRISPTSSPSTPTEPDPAIQGEDHGWETRTPSPAAAQARVRERARRARGHPWYSRHAGQAGYQGQAVRAGPAGPVPGVHDPRNHRPRLCLPLRQRDARRQAGPGSRAAAQPAAPPPAGDRGWPGRRETRRAGRRSPAARSHHRLAG